MKVDSGRALNRVDIAESRFEETGMAQMRVGEKERRKEDRERKQRPCRNLLVPLSHRMRLSETEISRCVDASRSVDSKQSVVSHGKSVNERGSKKRAQRRRTRRQRTMTTTTTRSDGETLLSLRRSLSFELINSAVITRVLIVLRDDRGARVVARCLINHPNELLPGPGNLPPRLSLHPPHESMNHSRVVLSRSFSLSLSLFFFSLPSSLCAARLCTNVYRLVTHPTKKGRDDGERRTEEEGGKRKKEEEDLKFYRAAVGRSIS